MAIHSEIARVEHTSTTFEDWWQDHWRKHGRSYEIYGDEQCFKLAAWCAWEQATSWTDYDLVDRWESEA
jgi:hypothetical protein